MASTYSPLLRFEKIAPGEQAGLWGDTTNQNIGTLIEQAIAGVSNVSLEAVSGDFELSVKNGIVDQARSAVINCIGAASGTVNLIIPTSTKLYVIRNNCGQTMFVKTATQTPGYELASGESNLVFCDGAQARAGFVTVGAATTPVSRGGTGAETFTAGYIKSPGGTAELAAVATIPAADITGQIAVSKGGTGQPSLNAGGLLIGNGTDPVATLTGGVNGYVPTWNSSTNTWVSTAPSAAGVTNISNGGNLTISGSVGPVTIGLSGSNVINALGYTPANGSLYAALNSSPTFTGSINATAYVATGAGSQGDQKFSVSYGGFSSGLAPASLQLGASGKGLIYDGNYIAIGGIAGGAVWSIGASTAVMVSSTDNVQKPSGGPWLATVSDARHKENVVDYSKGLEAITALRPVNYTFKGKYGEQTNYEVCTGLIAQEVLETPLSSMVGTNEDGFHNLNPNEISYALINAVKELSAKVTALEEQVLNLGVK